MFIYSILTTIWRKASILTDCLFRGGADFSDWLTQDELGISEKQGNKYQPSSGIIKRVFKNLNISSKMLLLILGAEKEELCICSTHLIFH